MKRIILYVIIFLSVAFTGCEDKTLCIEKIKEDCVCIQIYDPVCGCNNKTYGNACMAECASIMKYTKGECDKKLPDDKSKS